MHFVVSWDIKPDVSRQEEIGSALIESLRGYSWLRLLKTFYIVEIDYGQDWNHIQEKLLYAARKYPGEVNFLMSPIYDCDSNFFVLDMPDEDYYRNT